RSWPKLRRCSPTFRDPRPTKARRAGSDRKTVCRLAAFPRMLGNADDQHREVIAAVLSPSEPLEKPTKNTTRLYFIGRRGANERPAQAREPAWARLGTRSCRLDRLNLPSLRRTFNRFGVATERLQAIQGEGSAVLPALDRVCWEAPSRNPSMIGARCASCARAAA